MLVALGVVIVVMMLFGLWLNRSWYQSTWRIDQVTAIDRIDQLINRVVELSEEPDSGLLAGDIGDLKGDWIPVRAGLTEEYGLKAWWQSGRKSHTLEDRRVQALWTLAIKGAKPLLQVLAHHPGGRLLDSTIDQIFDVLSTDLDELASNSVTMKAFEASTGAFSLSR